MHILVVEDEEPSRRATLRLLEQHGHTTCWASTGESALEKLRTEPVDVIILDMMLGAGMNGWELAWRCKCDPMLARLPIIVLTGLTATEVRARSEPAERHPLDGVVVVLEKPPAEGVLLRYLTTLAASR
jgi:CheY-like chemotaxis protein